MYWNVNLMYIILYFVYYIKNFFTLHNTFYYVLIINKEDQIFKVLNNK